MWVLFCKLLVHDLGMPYPPKMLEIGADHFDIGFGKGVAGYAGDLPIWYNR